MRWVQYKKIKLEKVFLNKRLNKQSNENHKRFQRKFVAKILATSFPPIRRVSVGLVPKKSNDFYYYFGLFAELYTVHSSF